MNERTYVRFVPQEDNTNDVIKAEDINELQRSIEKLQEVSFIQGDQSFLNRALFTLQQHPDANSMIVDLLEDTSRINVPQLQGVVYDEISKSLSMDGSSLTGTAVTKVIYNETNKALYKLVLLVDEYKPEGTNITYEFSYDDITYHALVANQAIPITPPEARAQFYLRMRFEASDIEVLPRLDAWALLFQDPTYSFRFLDDGITMDIESDWDGTITS